MKIISYALFGYNKERNENCFDFNSYLRGLMINVRMNRLIYPDWKIILQTDQSTYKAFKSLFDNIGIIVEINEEAPLCKAMLWRMKPVFNNSYTHVICRDLDSPPTYKEAQCVQEWINNDKAAHAITDSISHNLPMLGGMIGFRPEYFFRVKAKNWEELVSIGNMDYKIKGSDQTFLNKFVYPRFASPGDDSITQHYLLGYGNTFLSDWHNKVPNIDLPIDPELKESNHVCGHIGSAGYYEGAMFKFLKKYWHQFNDLIVVEKQYSNIFFWTNES